MRNPSCLVLVVSFPLYAVTLGVSFFLLHPDAGVENVLVVLGESAGAAAGAAFCLTLATSWLRGAFRKHGELASFDRSRRGLLPDSGTVVLQGVLRPDGALVRAPVSGRECVVCRYAISRPSAVKGRRASTVRHLDAQGFAMSPCHVEGPLASVALLGFPDLWFRPERPRDPESYARARAFARSGAFEARRTVAREDLFEVQDVALRAGQPLRADHCTEDWSRELPFDPGFTDDSANCFLEEQSVAPGESVAVVGTYSASAGGVVPGPGGRPELRVRLYKGDASALLRTLRRHQVTYVALALAAAGAATAITLGFLSGGLQRALGW